MTGRGRISLSRKNPVASGTSRGDGGMTVGPSPGGEVSTRGRFRPVSGTKVGRGLKTRLGTDAWRTTNCDTSTVEVLLKLIQPKPVFRFESILTQRLLAGLSVPRTVSGAPTVVLFPSLSTVPRFPPNWTVPVPTST